MALVRSVFEGGFNNRIVRLSLAAEELPNIARSGVRELWWTINHHAGIYNGESHSDNKNRRFTRKAPVPDWDHERLFDRPGHIGGGGGGPFAESFF